MRTRVVHIGTGFTGSFALRGILADPALELVGWYVTSAQKVGQDAGEFCGRAPIGVRGTRRLEDLLELQADCLCYAGTAAGREMQACREIARFLERGTNVVTFAIIPMIYPPAAPAEMRELIEAACKKGNASFYASGSEPGMLTMPLPAALLSGASQVTGYREQQFVIDMANVYGIPEVLRESMGFGKPAGTIPNRFKDGTALNWWKPNLAFIADLLGVTIEDFRFNLETAPSDRDIHTGIGLFPAGTIAAYRWELHAIVNGRPALTVEYVALLTPEVIPPKHWPMPAADTKDAAVVYHVLGSPSYKAQIYLEAPPGQKSAAIPMTAMHVVNAIPAVVAAKPGVVHSLQLPYFVTRNITL